MRNQILNDHRDNRGFVVNPFEHLANTGDISNCHAFSIEPGCTRGNHTHPARNEQILVLSGDITVKQKDGNTTLSAKTPSILTIPRGIRHTFENNTKEIAVAICWSSNREEGYTGDDTVR
ncbi:MAG: cupin domain-containing protein [Candidatus Sabulitectum sp.]|nr:cupin domain-containing protein [Candidatus Sabulitectum sp.]